MENKLICEQDDSCDIMTCKHKEPHIKTSSCSKICFQKGINLVRCVEMEERVDEASTN